MREEEFKFDPLIAPDLLEAAEKLGINGLAVMSSIFRKL